MVLASTRRISRCSALSSRASSLEPLGEHAGERLNEGSYLGLVRYWLAMSRRIKGQKKESMSTWDPTATLCTGRCATARVMRRHNLAHSRRSFPQKYGPNAVPSPGIDVALR
jgi:hypothetical protein